MAPASVTQLVGASSHTPKCWRFDSWSGHMPRLWVWFPVGTCMGDDRYMFLSHIDVCLLFFLSLSLSEINKHIFFVKKTLVMLMISKLILPAWIPWAWNISKYPLATFTWTSNHQIKLNIAQTLFLIFSFHRSLTKSTLTTSCQILLCFLSFTLHIQTVKQFYWLYFQSHQERFRAPVQDGGVGRYWTPPPMNTMNLHLQTEQFPLKNWGLTGHLLYDEWETTQKR